MTKVLVIFAQPEKLSADLEKRFPEIEFRYASTGDAVLAQLAEHNPEVVFTMKEPSFPGHLHRPVVEHPSVRWVQLGGSGFDHMLPWDPNQVTLTNGAGVLSRFLAETITGAILMLNGNFLRYRSQQQNREWNPITFRSVEGQTLLIVGVGAIGGVLAENAKALGMRVIGVRGSDTPHHAVDVMYNSDQLIEVLPQANVVSLHVRLSPKTQHLIDATALAAMRPGSLLINTARGPVVDEQALITALNDGHIRGTYLDVFETEPLPNDSPLWEMPNVMLTPHASDGVGDWPERFGRNFGDNLERWQAGVALENVVSPVS